jgi:large subunit ribosomal protein L31
VRADQGDHQAGRRPRAALYKLETSSESHAFYTGTQKSVDSLGGRVEKFRNKFARVGLKK